jgi:hypothetical protein
MVSSHLSLMARKCDIPWWRGDVGWRRGGDDTSWADANPMGRKIKKIHMVDLVAING